LRVYAVECTLGIGNERWITAAQYFNMERYGFFQPGNLQCHHHVQMDIVTGGVTKCVNQRRQAVVGILCQFIDDDVSPRSLSFSRIDEASTFVNSWKARIFATPALVHRVTVMTVVRELRHLRVSRAIDVATIVRCIRRHSMIISGSPNSTGCASSNRIWTTVPDLGAGIWLSVFIASTISSVSPALTTEPTSQNGLAPGSGAR